MTKYKNLSILVVILLAVVGIFFWLTNGNTNVNMNGEGGSTVDLSGVDEKYTESAEFQNCVDLNVGLDTCLTDAVYNQILESDDINSCDDLKVVGLDGACINDYYLGKALETRDANVCDNMVDEAAKADCVSVLSSIDAIESKDATKCESLREDYQSSCLIAVINAKAMDAGDASICDQINGVLEDDDNTKLEIQICKDQVAIDLEMKKMELAE